MKRHYLPNLGCLLICLSAHAQYGDHAMGARSAAMANASVTLSNEWAAYSNIGALAIDQDKALFTSIKNKYGVRAFTTLCLGFVLPLKAGTGGIGACRFGDELYNEQQVRLGYSIQLGIVSLGVSTNYFQLNIEGLGSRRTFLIDFGGLARLSEQLFFGAHISNLNQARISKATDEKIPTYVKSGLSFRPNDATMFNIEVEKQIDRQTIVKFGLEYRIMPPLYFRAGFHTNPFESSVGLGFYPDRFKIDYAYTNNPTLNDIHEVSIGYLFHP